MSLQLYSEILLTICERRRALFITWVVFHFFFLSRPLEAFEVRGRVSVEPPYPSEQIKVLEEKHRACGGAVVLHSLIVGRQGGLENVLIRLQGNFPQDADDGGPRMTIPFLDQRDCHFVPHVLLVDPGRPFHILNSDPMDHDVRIFDGATMRLQFGMDPHEGPVIKTLEKPGRYVVRCGLHPWMHGYLIVREHPYYAVTGSEGEFVLTGVPEGRYNLCLWHERYEEICLPLEVRKDINDFSYAFPSP